MTDDDPLPPLFNEFPQVSTKQWEEKIREDLGTRETDSYLRWDSIDGISVAAYRRQEDLESISHLVEDVDVPALAGSAGWRIRQDVTHSDPSTIRRMATTARNGECTDFGFSLTDLRERTGAQDDVADEAFRTLLDEGLLENGHLHLDRGPDSAVVLAKLQSIIDGEDRQPHISGSVSCDPVAAVATGSISDPASAFSLTTDLLEASPSAELRTFCVDLRPYHEAGASAVQELAFGLGALSETLAHLLGQGVSFSSIVQHLHVVTSVSTSYFVEIAKLRALRLLVPQVINAFSAEAQQEFRMGPSDVFVQAETSRRSETLYAPYMNMLRGTTECMAAVLGGSDVVRVRPFDASFRESETFGTRIARNVQLILRHEAHFDVVTDPSAGSYYIETVTDQLAQKAWELFQTVEERGGILAALENGMVQDRIADVRSRRRDNVDERDHVVVGTNHYPDLDEHKWRDVKGTFSRNNGNQPVHELPHLSLEDIRTAMDDGHSPAEIVHGFAAGPSSIEPLPTYRIADDYEQLRLRTEKYAEETGQPPVVFLAPIGAPGPRSARSTFARNVFGVAGFEVEEHLDFDSVDEAVSTAAEADTEIFVLCSSDDAYPDLVPATKSALEVHDIKPLLVIAGNPDSIDSTLSADRFIYQGMAIRQTLAWFQEQLGMRD